MANHDNKHVGFVPDPNNGRGTIGILWLCLPTIFLCTYTVLHLNVPLVRMSKRQAFARKAFWTLMNILCPEAIILLALGQYFSARNLMKEFLNAESKAGHTGNDSGHSLLLSKAQAWYIGSYGLWISQQGKSTCAPLLWYNVRVFHRAQVFWLEKPDCRSLISEGIPNDEEIEDRSKTDTLGRLIACAQASWLVITIIARLAHHLDVSLLEVLTAGYVILALVTWAVWWYKPYDVRTQTILDVPDGVDFGPTSDELMKDLDRARSGSHSWPMLSQALDNSEPKSESTHNLICVSVSTIALAFGAVHIAAWNYPFATFAEAVLWRVSAVTIGVAPCIELPCMSYLGERGKRFHDITVAIGYLTAFIYVFARVFIIVETFLAFRSAPLGIYEQIQWSSYFGHIGA